MSKDEIDDEVEIGLEGKTVDRTENVAQQSGAREQKKQNCT